MAVAAPQPGLFDSGADGPAEGVYLLTNRHNVLRMLGAGLLLPRSGFAAKYYDDLLRLAPGRIPMLASGASAELSEMVISEPQSFPVMLEVRRASLSDDAFPALMRDGSHDRAGLGNADALMWAPTGALPFLDAVAAIHFRSDVEREEFEVREYAEIRPRSELHRTTSALFEAEGPSADQVTSWLGSLEPIDLPSEQDVSAEDRRSGAILLGASTAPTDEDELHGWGQLLTGKKVGKQSGEAVSRIARALDGGAKSRDPEEVALQICFETLASTNRLEVWRPLDILTTIREQLGRQLKVRAEGLLPALDRAAAIVSAEEPFEGLKASGSPTMKALLLTLIRPEPDRLIGWEPRGPGSDEVVLNLAATMVGILTGRSLTPVTFRPAGLDDALARVEGERLSTSRERALRPWKPPIAKVHRGESAIDLRLGTQILVQRPITATTADLPKVDSVLLQSAAVQSVALEIAMHRGWSDAVESVVEVPSGDWRTVRPSEADRPITIRFTGVGRIRQELLPDAFLAHVDRGELADDERAVLADIQGNSEAQ